MAMTLEQFRTRYPQFADPTLDPTFADVDPYAGVLQTILDEAERQINFDFFGDRGDDAHGYLSAHIALVTLPGAMANGVRSVTAGSASVTYADALNDLKSTGPGQMFERLKRLHGGARVVC